MAIEEKHESCDRCGKKIGETKQVATRCESKVGFEPLVITDIKYCKDCMTWQCNICFGYADKNKCHSCYFDKS